MALFVQLLTASLTVVHRTDAKGGDGNGIVSHADMNGGISDDEGEEDQEPVVDLDALVSMHIIHLP